VVDADGRLLGIVSLADLARAARRCAAPGLDGERVAATLAEICAEGPAPARPRRA
jgi:CBS domain-containing protein